MRDKKLSQLDIGLALPKNQFVSKQKNHYSNIGNGFFFFLYNMQDIQKKPAIHLYATDVNFVSNKNQVSRLENRLAD